MGWQCGTPATNSGLMERLLLQPARKIRSPPLMWYVGWMSQRSCHAFTLGIGSLHLVAGASGIVGDSKYWRTTRGVRLVGCRIASLPPVRPLLTRPLYCY